MDMKQDLKQLISDVLAKREAEAAQDRTALEALETVNLDNATYAVLLSSPWSDEEREQSVRVVYTGTLEATIKKAERLFSERCKVRCNLRPNCEVSIKLGDKAYFVPEEYWGQYRRVK